MVLVPEEALQRYEQRQRLETSPLMGTMMHKDMQMSDILQRDDVPDDEKQNLFNAYLERFLELRRQKETPSPVKKEEQRAEPQLSCLHRCWQPVRRIDMNRVFKFSLTHKTHSRCWRGGELEIECEISALHHIKMV